MIWFDEATAFLSRDAELMAQLLRACCEGNRFILKDQVRACEEHVAALVGVRFGVGLSNPALAVLLALRGLGVTRGDEVVISGLCPLYAVSAVARVGARALVVDVERDRAIMDVEAMLAKRSRAPRAVIVEHHPTSFCAIATIREAIGLDVPIIELATRALVKPADSGANLTVFSFDPTSPCCAAGDVAFAVTDDERLATWLRMARNHGQDGQRRMHHHFLGFNARVDEGVAHHLRARLPNSQARMALRQHISGQYDREIGQFGYRVASFGDPLRNRYFYGVLTPRPLALLQHLLAHDVQGRPCESCAVTRPAVLRGLGADPDACANASRYADSIVYLPCHAGLAVEARGAVIDAMRGFPQ